MFLAADGVPAANRGAEAASLARFVAGVVEALGHRNHVGWLAAFEQAADLT